MSIARVVGVSTKPYAGCSRVSDTRGRGYKANFYSPEEQKAGILEAARRERVEVALMAPDFDYSWESFARPGFQQALAGIRAGELAGIIVYRWDRFGAYEAVLRKLVTASARESRRIHPRMSSLFVRLAARL